MPTIDEERAKKFARDVNLGTQWRAHDLAPHPVATPSVAPKLNIAIAPPAQPAGTTSISLIPTVL